MSETFISGLNSILPEQGAQGSSGIGKFDLNDSTFSNILDEKLDKPQIDKTQVENIVEKLGIPAGVNIEGFDYNAMVNDLNSTEKIGRAHV